MASNNIKIHQNCKIVPPFSTQTTTTPLTFFDTFWLKFHPVERVFFYTLPNSQSHPTFFFQNIVPNLKSSLSLTLQHFLPLAGKIIWPSDSPKPFIQFNPNNDDGVSFLIAESDLDFNHVVQFSPQDVSFSRSLIPLLEVTDDFASTISIQITLFPENGFSIGISTHHAVFDGKSSTLFMKAWAYLCKKTTETEQESPTPTPTLLPPKFQPLFNREIVHDPDELGGIFANNWIKSTKEKGNEKSLKISPFEPNLEDSLRATFNLTRSDLDKIKQRVLSKWEIFNTNNELNSKPKTLSTFVLASAYSFVSFAKAIHGIENKKEKFALVFTVDCRTRLEPPLPENYFGNCVWGHFVDKQPLDFIQEDGVFLVAKSIHETIQMIKEKGVFEGFNVGINKFLELICQGIEVMGVSGSTRFGVYEIDFGWGKAEKVEVVSIDRGSTIAFAESRDGKGGVEVGVVLKRNAMNLFSKMFLEEL